MPNLQGFRGGLDTPDPKDAANIKGKVLVLHGGDDPYVTAEQMTAFQEEMRKAGVDWQVVIYGGAVHSFTNKLQQHKKTVRRRKRWLPRSVQM